MTFKSIRDQLGQLSKPASVANKTCVSMAVLLTLACQPVNAEQITSCSIFNDDCYSNGIDESLYIDDYSFNSTIFFNHGLIKYRLKR